jgi:hypothetical protein
VAIKVSDLLLEFRCKVAQVLIGDAIRKLTRQTVASGNLISKFLLFPVPVHFHWTRESGKSSNLVTIR